MSWKYVMWQVGDQCYPVIFPQELVHEDVARHVHPLFVQMARSMPADTIRTPISAGFIEGLLVAATVGESETLRMNSRPEDAGIIIRRPYDHGRESPMSKLIELQMLNAILPNMLKRMEAIMKPTEVIEHEGPIAFEREFAQAEGNLKNLPDHELDAVYDKFIEWFDYERVEDLNRKNIIDHIMGADPIAVEGGLLDFLVQHKLLDHVDED
jgi:hypothetical protein